MTVPPFPSQDLAKLVLGYLAEEQLMTAYDEFLQASPYLDALQNEYDRIFMTSLKSILAEYRAVKIYVETCKPISLRKKIFQCTNLLDIVKLLVNYIDLNKLQSQEAADRTNTEKQHSVNANNSNSCDTCALSKLSSCICKQRTLSINQSHAEANHQNSTETTPLADLPGNHVTTRKKQMKVFEKDNLLSSDGQSSGSIEKETCNVGVEESASSLSIQMKNDISTVSLNSTVKAIDLAESRQKIEEFDNVLKSVLDKNNTVTGSENKPNQRISNANTFQDFASGVTGGESQNPNVPDSSTSDSLSIQTPITKDYYKDNVIGPQKGQLLIQVSKRNENIEIQTCRKEKNTKYSKIKVKPDDQKVKILSDVKVTNKKRIVKNATSTPVTSTPLVQMQTIVINGKPAYNRLPVVTKHLYTKDEIMAMPTLIVVPASGPTITSANCKPIMTQKCKAISACSTADPLGPLVIDVPPTPDIVNKPDVTTKLSELNIPEPLEAGLVKTVDFSKNASVPKDNVVCAATKTPQVLPPVRKSSSTPRRTTHVRVLDFTTPRRILHETINEQVTSQTTDAPVEILLSSSPNVSFVDTTVADNTQVNTNTNAVHSIAAAQKADAIDNDTGSAKENNTNDLNPPKKSDWDADLRAIVAHDSALPSTITKRKKNTKKKKSDSKTEKKAVSIISPKIKKVPKKRRQVIEDDDDNSPEAAVKPDVPVKPTINIISGNDCVATDVPFIVQENKKDDFILNKSGDKDDECAETPEGDRLSLQNVIGARLNISDLLETPYKQALYDIQMGTPRFLPDLPGEPLSDIKITNIPTPRFFDTPKPVQATPSSWSSRPTDYSSGGSYYKPDDQDSMPMPDLRCVVSSSKEDITSDKSVEITKDDERKSRPQRKCAKNVSYYRYGNSTNKVKEADDTFEAASTCSESTGSDCKNKELAPKTPRDRSKSNKSEIKKRVPYRKKKSPVVKEKAKTFIKIRARQTPTKLTPGRNRKKNESPGYHSPGKLKRYRHTSKNMNLTPLVVAAPTKSRRKSSTPRKLHCTKSFNSENRNHTSPETIANTKQNAATVPNAQDSDTEQLALRWSDDGSQDTKVKELPTTSTATDCEDISQIQEYIKTTSINRLPVNDVQGSFQVDLMKRGFDEVTAEKIERDLLDTPPPISDKAVTKSPAKIVQTKKDEPTVERCVESHCSAANKDLLVEDETEEDDELELSNHDCNEESNNYFTFHHDYTKETPQGPPIRLKDTFSMNICIDDGVTVRLRATPFSLPLDQDPISVEEIDYSYDYRETEMAVNSISNIDRLYTPIKESFKAQCYSIFDSTLTSLDTPLKARSPVKVDCSTTVTEIVLEEDKSQKDKTDLKKRKRSNDSDESTSDTKKTKYLLTSASIQNIDIESVLTKLHGP